MTYTIIESEFTERRSALYAKATHCRDVEVLFVGSEAPGDSRYTWEHVPEMKISMGPLSLRSSLRLRTALGFSHSKMWIVVKPDIGQLIGLCLLARKKSVALVVWLDESQFRVWFGVTFLRAAGFRIETQHLGPGLAQFAAGGGGQDAEISKGEAANEPA